LVVVHKITSLKTTISQAIKNEKKYKLLNTAGYQKNLLTIKLVVFEDKAIVDSRFCPGAAF